MSLLIILYIIRTLSLIALPVLLFYAVFRVIKRKSILLIVCGIIVLLIIMQYCVMQSIYYRRELSVDSWVFLYCTTELYNRNHGEYPKSIDRIIKEGYISRMPKEYFSGGFGKNYYMPESESTHDDSGEYNGGWIYSNDKNGQFVISPNVGQIGFEFDPQIYLDESKSNCDEWLFAYGERYNKHIKSSMRKK